MSFGAAPIGNFLHPFSESEAAGMVDQAWDLGMRYFDTAPLYGHGLSEYRLGHALRERPRDEYVVSTKVGRVLKPAAQGSFDSGLWVRPAPFAAEYDYTFDGIMRAVEDSLQRLLLDRVDILFMHDIDRYTHGDLQESMFRTALDSGFAALERLRAEGVVDAIGFGVNEADVCAEAVRRADADCVLLAGRYTLLEQEPLDHLLPMCAEREIGVVLGGVYNSGILATGPTTGAKFNYGPAPKPVMERARRLQAVCDRHDVPLPAAALHFAAAHPVVSSICIGSRTQQQQAASAAWLELDLPSALWDDLRREGLLREDAPTP
ncbi:MAG TPA: aldo/keto reductase [Intrasporangium sp.]|uniref:aldo/keto reductase n=1 Tax=Intrasporangium sp. TaxID=1925024 RepID=UPI002D78575D|nr:aldo/keto reductase [Intrasporangium sp.]HET7399185.1 aldo/keto reductase [Intrasporangium sp.]